MGGGGSRPEVVRALLSPDDVSRDAEVIGTNIVAAGITLVVILLTATLFNQTVQENSEEIEGFVSRLFTPLRGVGRALRGGWEVASGRRQGVGAFVAPVAVLGVAGLVYGFSEPGFGFNSHSLVIFLSLVLGIGAVTYVYGGSQAILTSLGFGVPAGVKLFPIGVGVAVISVLFSRLDGFQPGIIYGFIASYAVLAEVSLDRRQQGQTILFPGLVLLAVCVIAWALVVPFRDLAKDHSSWMTAVPEAVAAAIFVGGLEGLFFNMVPLRFMDGHKLWGWNKGAWLAMAGVTAFLFWHVLLNKERAYFSSLQETTVATAVVLVGACLAITIVAWLFFRIRAARAESGSAAT